MTVMKLFWTYELAGGCGMRLPKMIACKEADMQELLVHIAGLHLGCCKNFTVKLGAHFIVLTAVDAFDQLSAGLPVRIPPMTGGIFCDSAQIRQVVATPETPMTGATQKSMDVPHAGFQKLHSAHAGVDGASSAHAAH